VDISKQVKDLQEMGREDLCNLWRERFNQSAPDGIRKELLVRMLAYRIQELAFGGLSAQARRRLDQMTRALATEEKASGNKVNARPGTTLVRLWKGKTHKVVIEESGYEYNGQSYKSLSAIARHITGTPWSGPLFFGLRARGSSKETENAE
jgi:hypothetical protein